MYIYYFIVILTLSLGTIDVHRLSIITPGCADGGCRSRERAARRAQRRYELDDVVNAGVGAAVDVGAGGAGQGSILDCVDWQRFVNAVERQCQ